nr:f-box/lrr-repeat protein [Quercus suber]
MVLILGLDILIDPPPASSAIALLSLKTLHLEHVKYANKEAFGRLLSGCSVLQNFFLTAFGLKTTYEFKIIVLTLKELHLWINYDGFLLKINAPALQYLHFRGTLYSDILLENSNQLS